MKIYEVSAIGIEPDDADGNPPDNKYFVSKEKAREYLTWLRKYCIKYAKQHPDTKENFVALFDKESNLLNEIDTED